MKNDNQLMIKSEELALQVIKIRKFLEKNGEGVLSNQLVKSGTSVGANVCEAIDSFSKNEFYFKITIALKEARETNYWLKLIYKSEYITEEMYIIKFFCSAFCFLLSAFCFLLSALIFIL